MKQKLGFLGFVTTFFATALAGHSADWPQYRGPNHDGSTPETISTKWPQEGPRQIWKAELGDSFGSFAVGGGKAFCFIQRKVNGEDAEVAIALDANTGKEVWSSPLGKPTYDRQGGDGPRSTPTIDGDRVYFLGAYLVLSCLDAKTGKTIWLQDLVKDFDGDVIKWNHAGSPVLDGDLIFVNAGGEGQAFLAFNKKDGKVAWKTGSDKPTHASPVPATIHGIRQVIFFTQSGLISTEASTGKIVWQHDFRSKFQPRAIPLSGTTSFIVQRVTEWAEGLSKFQRTEINFPRKNFGGTKAKRSTTGPRPFARMGTSTGFLVSRNLAARR